MNYFKITLLIISLLLTAACGQSESEKEAERIKKSRLSRIEGNLNIVYRNSSIECKNDKKCALKKFDEFKQQRIQSNPDLADEIEKMKPRE